MKNFKKIISLLLALSLVLCMAAFTSCDGTEDPEGDGEDGKITYTVTVKDTSGAAVKAAKVQLYLDGIVPVGKAEETSEDGTVSFKLDEGNYSAGIESVPEGYVKPTDKVALTNAAAEVTVEKLPTYTVYVKDASGAGIAGVSVQLCSDAGCKLPKQTDEDGKIVFVFEADDYKAMVIGAPEGYTFSSEYFPLSNNEVTIVLEAE